MIIKDSGNHGDGSRLDDASADLFRASGAQEDQALQSQGPFPSNEASIRSSATTAAVVSALFENINQSF